MTPTLAPTPSPTPTPTPVPTPTPLPPVTEDQLMAACDGTPIPGAAKYVSGVHPLIIVYDSNFSGSGAPEWAIDKDPYYNYPINAQWYQGLWTGPIQLVVCVPAEKPVKVSSCGNYKRDSDGKVGAVITYKYGETVRVVVAATGKVLQSTTIYGSSPSCAKSFPDPGASPPWRVYGSDPSDATINKYATTVSTQKVK